MPYLSKDRQADYQHSWYIEHKDTYRNRNKERRAMHKAWFNEITQNIECLVCGEKDHSVLDFHHLDPSLKVDGVCKMVKDFRSKEKILEEMSKCAILCGNCHRKYHMGLIELPSYKEVEVEVDL